MPSISPGFCSTGCSLRPWPSGTSWFWQNGMNSAGTASHHGDKMHGLKIRRQRCVVPKHKPPFFGSWRSSMDNTGCNPTNSTWLIWLAVCAYILGLLSHTGPILVPYQNHSSHAARLIFQLCALPRPNLSGLRCHGAGHGGSWRSQG